ncbi:hypothetical protein HDU67_008386 [Dinochytrium kinnereticum]|nr:hypothetical protein HDU67_008386 [Dinochytrium kinnereticum]
MMVCACLDPQGKKVSYVAVLLGLGLITQQQIPYITLRIAKVILQATEFRQYLSTKLADLGVLDKQKAQGFLEDGHFVFFESTFLDRNVPVRYSDEISKKVKNIMKRDSDGSVIGNVIVGPPEIIVLLREGQDVTVTVPASLKDCLSDLKSWLLPVSCGNSTMCAFLLNGLAKQNSVDMARFGILRDNSINLHFNGTRNDDIQEIKIEEEKYITLNGFFFKLCGIDKKPFVTCMIERRRSLCVIIPLSYDRGAPKVLQPEFRNLNVMLEDLESVSKRTAAWRNADAITPDLVRKASNLSEKLTTAMSVYDGCKSASEFIKEFKGTPNVILGALECIAGIGGMIPFVSTISIVVSKCLDFSKSLKKEMDDIVYIVTICQQLDCAIQTRIKAYFAENSNLVVDNELCMESLHDALLDGIKLLVQSIEMAGEYHGRKLVGKLIDHALGSYDTASVERNLKDAITNILLADPQHFAINLEYVTLNLDEEDAVNFWRGQRFRISVSTENFVAGLERWEKFKALTSEDICLSTSKTIGDIFKLVVINNLDRNGDGFVHVKEFATWTQSHRGLENSLRRVLEDVSKCLSDSEISAAGQLDSEKRINFSGDIQAALDDYIPDTRMWILDHIARWYQEEDSCALWLTAEPGFGKSVVSALCVTELPVKLVVYFFFKIDEEAARDANAFVDSIASQVDARLSENNARGKWLKNRGVKDTFAKDTPHSLFEKFKFMVLDRLESETETGLSRFPLLLVIDAADECPKSCFAKFLCLLQQTIDFCTEERRKTKGCLNGGNLNDEDPVLCSNFPYNLRILITSRRQDDIDRFIFGMSDSQKVTHLHIKPKSSGFLNRFSRFRSERTSKSFEEDFNRDIFERNREDLLAYVDSFSLPLLESSRRKLIEMSQGNMLWLKIALNLIKDINPDMASSIIGSTLKRDIKSLYFICIGNFLERLGNRNLVETIIGISLVAKTPLSINEISYMLYLSKPLSLLEEERRAVMKAIIIPIYKSVLRENSKGLIYAGHKSLRDALSERHFLSDVRIREVHRTLAEACLMQLEKLQMYERRATSDNRGLKNGEYESFVSQYAAEFWHHHAEIVFRDSEESTTAKSKLAGLIVHWFSTAKPLYWVRFLASMNRLQPLHAALSFVMVNQELKEAHSNARWLKSMVFRFSNILIDDPDEMYCTVFAFSTHKPELKAMFSGLDRQIAKVPKAIKGLDAFWDAEDLAFDPKEGRSFKIFQSDDSGVFISAIEVLKKVPLNWTRRLCRVWDKYSGKCIGALFDDLGDQLENVHLISGGIAESSYGFVDTFMFAIYKASKLLYFWNISSGVSGKIILKCQPQHLEIIPEGPNCKEIQIALGLSDGTILIWHVTTFTPLQGAITEVDMTKTYILPNSTGPLVRLGVNRDSMFLTIAAVNEKQVILYRLEPGCSRLNVLRQDIIVLPDDSSHNYTFSFIQFTECAEGILIILANGRDMSKVFAWSVAYGLVEIYSGRALTADQLATDSDSLFIIGRENNGTLWRKSITNLGEGMQAIQVNVLEKDTLDSDLDLKIRYSNIPSGGILAFALLSSEEEFIRFIRPNCVDKAVYKFYFGFAVDFELSSFGELIYWHDTKISLVLVERFLVPENLLTSNRTSWDLLKPIKDFDVSPNGIIVHLQSYRVTLWDLDGTYLGELEIEGNADSVQLAIDATRFVGLDMGFGAFAYEICNDDGVECAFKRVWQADRTWDRGVGMDTHLRFLVNRTLVVDWPGQTRQPVTPGMEHFEDNFDDGETAYDPIPDESNYQEVQNSEDVDDEDEFFGFGLDFPTDMTSYEHLTPEINESPPEPYDAIKVLALLDGEYFLTIGTRGSWIRIWMVPENFTNKYLREDEDSVFSYQYDSDVVTFDCKVLQDKQAVFVIALQSGIVVKSVLELGYPPNRLPSTFLFSRQLTLMNSDEREKLEIGLIRRIEFLHVSTDVFALEFEDMRKHRWLLLISSETGASFQTVQAVLYWQPVSFSAVHGVVMLCETGELLWLSFETGIDHAAIAPRSIRLLFLPQAVLMGLCSYQNGVYQKKNEKNGGKFFFVGPRLVFYSEAHLNIIDIEGMLPLASKHINL